MFVVSSLIAFCIFSTCSVVPADEAAGGAAAKAAAGAGAAKAAVAAAAAPDEPLSLTRFISNSLSLRKSKLALAFGAS